jgi:glycosyltransferase involved in cell wall biosynthesis
MTRLELARTRRYEGWLVGQFDRVLVTSEVDKNALEGLAREKSANQRTSELAKQLMSAGNRESEIRNPKSEITVLPNGVDLAYFCPDDTPRDPATVLFSGKMSYHANVTAALHLVHDIMPLVWRERPEVKVVIAGKDPPSEIRNLDSAMPETAGHAVRNPQSEIRNVTVTGTIPDLRPYLRSATVAVSPLLYGAGIQNKVLEAMACGTPVVASSQAVSALQTTDGEDLLVASDAETFAHHILAVLGDRSLAQRLGLAGRRYVEAHHDWNEIAKRLEAIYQEVQ